MKASLNLKYLLLLNFIISGCGGNDIPKFGNPIIRNQTTPTLTSQPSSSLNASSSRNQSSIQFNAPMLLDDRKLARLPESARALFEKIRAGLRIENSEIVNASVDFFATRAGGNSDNPLQCIQEASRGISANDILARKSEIERYLEVRLGHPLFVQPRSVEALNPLNLCANGRLQSFSATVFHTMVLLNAGFHDFAVIIKQGEFLIASTAVSENATNLKVISLTTRESHSSDIILNADFNDHIRVIDPASFLILAIYGTSIENPRQTVNHILRENAQNFHFDLSKTEHGLAVSNTALASDLNRVPSLAQSLNLFGFGTYQPSRSHFPRLASARNRDYTY